MRYLVASLVSPATETQIRQAYKQTYDAPCPVKSLHLTFIPPFTTDDPQNVLNQLTPTLTPTNYTTGPAAIFQRAKNILYYPLEPQKPLIDYYQRLFPSVKPLITFAVTGFPPGDIPPFLPHITLDYHFRLPLNLNPPQLPISLTPPQLLSELGPGTWQPHVF